MKVLARELAARLAPGARLERIASRVGERTTVLEVAKVSHFFSKDKLTFASLGGREHVVDFTLGELEERLDPGRFVRIHRATIANLGFIGELYPGVDGVVVRLKDEKKTELGVSRDRVRDLKERLGISACPFIRAVCPFTPGNGPLAENVTAGTLFSSII